jgi:hypothetical protein
MAITSQTRRDDYRQRASCSNREDHTPRHKKWFEGYSVTARFERSPMLDVSDFSGSNSVRTAELYLKQSHIMRYRSKQNSSWGRREATDTRRRRTLLLIMCRLRRVASLRTSCEFSQSRRMNLVVEHGQYLSAITSRIERDMNPRIA